MVQSGCLRVGEARENRQRVILAANQYQTRHREMAGLYFHTFRFVEKCQKMMMLSMAAKKHQTEMNVCV